MIDKKKLNDAMKGKKTPTQPTDPNMTLEVQNPEVEELMKNYAQEKTPEHLNLHKQAADSQGTEERGCHQYAVSRSQ